MAARTNVIVSNTYQNSLLVYFPLISDLLLATCGLSFPIFFIKRKNKVFCKSCGEERSNISNLNGVNLGKSGQ